MNETGLSEDCNIRYLITGVKLYIKYGIIHRVLMQNCLLVDWISSFRKLIVWLKWDLFTNTRIVAVDT